MAMENKVVVAVLICALLGSSMVVTMGYAQTSIPTPSVPEFTLKFVDNSYDVPTTTTVFSTTDPYTNRTTTRNATQQGYHVKKFDIEVTIKNQPFPSTINGNISNLYFDVASYGHFENITVIPLEIRSPTGIGLILQSTDGLTPQSNSEYTVINVSANFFPPGGEVDFRVAAVLGYTYRDYISGHILPVYNDEFLYASSDWSDAQTIVIPQASPSPSPILTLIPTQSPISTTSPILVPSPFPQNCQAGTKLLFYAVIALIAIVIALLLVIILMLRKRK
jgi:hypothetical protein